MKSILQSLILLGAISLLLSSCPVEKPEVLAFDTDLRVLRGNWTATIPDKVDPAITKTANLNLIATYIDANSYLISGSFQIAGEAIQNVQGLVKGGVYQTFTKSTPRTSILQLTLAELLLSTEVGQPPTQVLKFCPYPYKSPNNQWQYQAILEPVTQNRIPFSICTIGSQGGQWVVVTRKP
jgi:hypothetical protein